jgi:hypothetical protein
MAQWPPNRGARAPAILQQAGIGTSFHHFRKSYKFILLLPIDYLAVKLVQAGAQSNRDLPQIFLGLCK